MSALARLSDIDTVSDEVSLAQQDSNQEADNKDWSVGKTPMRVRGLASDAREVIWEYCQRFLEGLE